MKGVGSVSTNELTKAADVRKKNVDKNSLSYALKNGGSVVWLSCLIMGAGNLVAGQGFKALLFLLIEVIFVGFDGIRIARRNRIHNTVAHMVLQDHFSRIVQR